MEGKPGCHIEMSAGGFPPTDIQGPSVVEIGFSSTIAFSAQLEIPDFETQRTGKLSFDGAPNSPTPPVHLAARRNFGPHFRCSA